MKSMRIKVDVYDHYPLARIRKSLIRELKIFLNKVLRSEIPFKKLEIQRRIYLSVILVNNYYIRRLNRKFLGRNRATDVLAFPLAPGLLGEIYISYDKVKSQARALHHKESEELRYLALHGLLHLLGYNHRTMVKRLRCFI